MKRKFTAGLCCVCLWLFFKMRLSLFMTTWGFISRFYWGNRPPILPSSCPSFPPVMGSHCTIAPSPIHKVPKEGTSWADYYSIEHKSLNIKSGEEVICQWLTLEVLCQSSRTQSMVSYVLLSPGRVITLSFSWVTLLMQCWVPHSRVITEMLKNRLHIREWNSGY
jgi:hypothetical protein